jgi:hypothetical protein
MGNACSPHDGAHASRPLNHGPDELPEALRQARHVLFCVLHSGWVEPRQVGEVPGIVGGEPPWKPMQPQQSSVGLLGGPGGTSAVVVVMASGWSTSTSRHCLLSRIYNPASSQASARGD